MPAPRKGLLAALATAATAILGAAPLPYPTPPSPPMACPVPDARPQVGSLTSVDPAYSGTARLAEALQRPDWKALLNDADAEVGAARRS